MLAVNIGILDFLSMLLNVFAVVAVDAVLVAALLAVVVDGVIASVVAAHNVGELVCVCVCMPSSCIVSVARRLRYRTSRAGK